MPHLRVVERDYVNLYNRFISFGPLARQSGIVAHGVWWDIQDFYDKLLESHSTQRWDGQAYPSLDDAVEAANGILYLAPETNGEVADHLCLVLRFASVAQDPEFVIPSWGKVFSLPWRRWRRRFGPARIAMGAWSIP